MGLQTIKEEIAFEEINADGRIILKLILNKFRVRILARFTWLRVGTSGGLL
jgi:hypothetical protein